VVIGFVPEGSSSALRGAMVANWFMSAAWTPVTPLRALGCATTPREAYGKRAGGADELMS
jgi:hypothetical protein